MNYSEKTVYLSPDEIDKLRKDHRLGTILSFIVLVIMLGAATFFFILGEDFLPFRIFAPIFALVAIAIVFLNFYRQRKDIQGGVKTIITGEIEDKKETHSSRSNSQSSDTYTFILGGKEVEVTSLNYNKFHVKDCIEITKLPHAGTLLDIRLIESATGIRGNQLTTTKLDGSPLGDARSFTTAEFSETSYPLDSAEEQFLRRTRNKRVVRSFKWALIPLWLFLAFKFLASDFNPILFLQSFRLNIVLVIVLLPAIIQVLRIPRILTPFNQDITSGMKVIRRTTIADKTRNTKNRRTSLIVTLGEKQYSVPENFYSNVTIGQEVALHYAEYSKTEFSINSTSDRSASVEFYL